MSPAEQKARRSSDASYCSRSTAAADTCADLPGPSPFPSARPFPPFPVIFTPTHHITSVNITTGPPEDRPMTTGLHTVRDIACAKCGEVLGWRYGEFGIAAGWSAWVDEMMMDMRSTAWCVGEL